MRSSSTTNPRATTASRASDSALHPLRFSKACSRNSPLCSTRPTVSRRLKGCEAPCSCHLHRCAAIDGRLPYLEFARSRRCEIVHPPSADQLGTASVAAIVGHHGAPDYHCHRPGKCRNYRRLLSQTRFASRPETIEANRYADHSSRSTAHNACIVAAHPDFRVTRAP